MKKLNLILSLIALTLLLMTSCEDEVVDRRIYKGNVPVYMTYPEFKSAMKLTEPRDLEKPGKIYFKDNYIFINEMFEGIHIYDNTDPSNPINKSFIELPSNLDIAIADNYLYADSYTDLVVIDISDVNNPTEVYRIDSAFPYSIPPYDSRFPLTEIDESQGVVVGFEVQEITEEIIVSEEDLRWRNFLFMEDAGGWGVDMVGTTSGSDFSIGVAGSMAKFMIYDQYLYTLFLSEMKLFELVNLAEPFESNTVHINWDIETLFRYEDKMFIGAQTGMYIYDLVNPGSPTYISEFTHANSCDPVVVENDIAYVTLRSGTECNGFTNQLDVIDVANIENPVHLKTYQMTNPHGLGIDDGTLFICDGDDGLKIYDAEDPLEIAANQIAHYNNISAKDVIPLGNLLLMIGNDGLYQYDYSNLDDIRLLSKIEVKEQ